MKVLIIDDEPAVRASIETILREHESESLQAGNAEEAFAQLESNTAGSFDVILLDVQLPGRSGMDFLEDLRASGNVTPVIFVTASEGVENRVRGLRSGADDYIVKPFSPEELIARIEAVDRRQHVLPVVQVADLSVDMGRRTAERAGMRIDISPREYDLLVALLEARGETCSRADLLSKVWGIQEDTGTNVVEVQVARLRRKIDKDQTPLIHTVTGIGYKLTDKPKGDVQKAQ